MLESFKKDFGRADENLSHGPAVSAVNGDRRVRDVLPLCQNMVEQGAFPRAFGAVKMQTLSASNPVSDDFGFPLAAYKSIGMENHKNPA
jgi:hypothetical protein